MTYYSTLAARGLEEPFFPVVLCVVSVLGLVGNRFWFTYSCIRVQYSCGVVLGFWLQRKIVFCVTYILSVVVLLCQFFGCSGK
jgi:hypothetical protein